MCSLFGLIDYKEALPVKEKNRIVNTLARECEIRGTDATGIAYHFGRRLRIFKRPLPAHKLRLRVPPGVSVIMGHTRMTTQGNEKFNQNNHPFAGSVGGKHLGRPPTPLPENWQSVLDLWRSGQITAREAMRQTGLHRSTFYNKVKTMVH